MAGDSTDSIPLYDGEPSGAKIIHPSAPAGLAGASASGAAAPPLRGKRRSPRKDCSNILVCFSPCDPSGRVEHVACPVFNISRAGFAIEFDRPLAAGVTGTLSYRTIAHRPVRVTCTVRHCRPLGGGRYKLGIALDRHLGGEELRPARSRAGREVSPWLHTRPLRPREAAKRDDGK